MIQLLHIPKNAGTSMQKAIGTPSIGHKRFKDLKDGEYFACARNPYDRAVSVYWFMRKIQTNIPFNLAATFKTLDEFWRDMPKDRAKERVKLIDPQMDFLCEKDGTGISPRIKTILRFETLADDWPAFAAEHDLPPLPHKNKSELRPATHWSEQLNKESIAKIGEIYADDFEHLNYERIL